jgi:hypothetical protein
MRLFTPADQARARRFYEREGWTLRAEPYFEAALGLDLVLSRDSSGEVPMFEPADGGWVVE